MTAAHNGAVSFWQSSLPPWTPRPALRGTAEADVCIVGAGYTGLWTAFALAEADPALRIVVVEARHVGFGASGRNGGWLSGLLPGDRARLAKGPGGRQAVIDLQRALFAAVDEVIDLCAVEGIDADVRKGGSLAVATTADQHRRLVDELAADRQWGWGPDDAWALDPDQLAERVKVAGARSGLFTPHCARIHPARLVRGVAGAAEQRGVTIHEHSPAVTVDDHLVRTDQGQVRCRWVVRATEGFTAGLAGQRRALLPMNSSMLVTEPLDPATWAEIGWDGAETIRDGAHAYAYAQRTADGRIAIGGRGAPYRFGSRTDRDGAVPPATVAALEQTLHRLWPATRDAGVAHAWCGVLGVARDWCPTVTVDRDRATAWAGGYVGDGVTASYLAGRTLADLITGADTPRTRLAWVGHRSRRWEPEPLRWAGVHAVYALYRAADRAGSLPPGSGGRGEVIAQRGSATFARLGDVLAGRH